METVSNPRWFFRGVTGRCGCLPGSAREAKGIPTMRETKASRRMFAALLSLVLTLCLVSISSQPAFADTGKDFVIVIDVSTSMQDVFEEVKEITKKTLRDARTGDNVAVITFGEEATLLDRKQIRGKKDIEHLEQQVDKLYPTDYATYIGRGMEKSLSELRYLLEKDPKRERVLLWLSDGKDNPPAEIGDEFITLEKLREAQRDFEPEREWFAYKAPLSEVKNDVLEDFITWARRTTFRVAVKEENIELGSFENENVRQNVVLTFQPKNPGAAGLEIYVKARLRDPNDPSRGIPVSLSPQQIVASGNEWQQQFQLAFAAEEPGQYTGELVFEPVSGPMLDIEPRRVAFTATVVGPKVAMIEPEKPPEEPRPTGILAEAKERGIIATEDRPPGMTRPDKPLSFGPLEPGKKDSKIITLYLNKEANSDSIVHDASIQLPEGINVDTQVFGRGTRLAAEITVSVDRDAAVAAELLESAYEGNMSFTSNEAGVEILPLYIPIRVALNTDRVRWGKKMLPETGVGRLRAKTMTFEELTEELGTTEEKPASPIVSALRDIYSRLKSRYVLFPILGALVVLLVILLYRMRPPSELFVGELVVIKDPGDSKMKNVNLKRVGSLHGKDVLTIGSSPKADIRLQHASVAPIHCRIFARTVEDQAEISIQPAKGESFKVNDVERPEKTVLSDKDLLGIGDFILLFSRPEEQKEVVVHFRDGRTMRGTPVTWDIGSPSFELLRTDSAEMEETAEEITVVHFADLKAVFFMQDSAGSRSSVPQDRVKTEELLEVIFYDGETIEGHPLVDYSDVSGRFYLIPREMPNILSVLIERTSVKDIVSKESRGEPETARSAGLFGIGKKRKGTAPAE